MTEARRDAPSWRPLVTMNVAESADGKIAPVDGGKVNFGGDEDRMQMELLRAEADAVLIGGGTLLTEDPPLLIRDPALRERRRTARGTPHPLNVTVCSSLPPRLASMSFFLHPETEKLVFTTERTAPDLIEVAARLARVEVVALDSTGRVDVVEVVRRLSTLGVRHLLLEGGGELNFSMLRSGLVDEVYLTICPFLFGGRTAPSPVGGEGLPREQVRKLSLKSHRVGTHGEVFLRYDVLPGPPLVSPSRLFAGGFEVS
jgi:riboflavin-specific deaminase-like protein